VSRRSLSGERTRDRATSRSVAGAVTTFALTGLLVVAVVGVVETLALRRAGEERAVDAARTVTQVVARGIVEPNLSPAALNGDPAAIQRLDRIVHDRVLNADLVRMKIWNADGTIVYSDEPRLVGTTYPLGADEQQAIRSGTAEAELSDLSRPENRFERPYDKLLEVYLPIAGPGGDPLLFEAYLRYSAVAASARDFWLSFLPALAIGLLVLWGVQTPLALRLARRLRSGQLEREALLRQAIESSDTERRRIAGDVHDGAVQDLAGISYSLAAAAERTADTTSEETAAVLRGAADGTRKTMRELRTLLVDIYPPNLQTAGLEAALSDLLAPVTAAGADAHLEVQPDLEIAPEREALVFRSAQEVLRNVGEHAHASRVDVRIEGNDGQVVLQVDDDGIGFSEEQARQRREEGHVGLRLLGDLVAAAGGELRVESEPNHGTRVRVEVPRE
jgi:two-component system NarL family sensor kinase